MKVFHKIPSQGHFCLLPIQRLQFYSIRKILLFNVKYVKAKDTSLCKSFQWIRFEMLLCWKKNKLTHILSKKDTKWEWKLCNFMNLEIPNWDLSISCGVHFYSIEKISKIRVLLYCIEWINFSAVSLCCSV